MKRIGTVCALVLVVVTPVHLFASSTFIDGSGHQLTSIFDGLKPNPISPSALRGLQSPFDMAHLSAHLSAMPKGFFIIGGSGCPNGELCSGGFAHTVSTFPGECNQAGDEDVCPIQDFVNDTSDGCAAGIEQSYCGTFCCVSANHCDNPRNCAGPQ